MTKPQSLRLAALAAFFAACFLAGLLAIAHAIAARYENEFLMCWIVCAPFMAVAIAFATFDVAHSADA